MIFAIGQEKSSKRTKITIKRIDRAFIQEKIGHALIGVGMLAVLLGASGVDCPTNNMTLVYGVVAAGLLMAIVGEVVSDAFW